MFKINFLILAISILFSANSKLIAEQGQSDENFLPFYAELTQEFSPEDKSIKLEKGERFIILRPLDNELLLVEFPRKGTYKVPYSLTNVEKYIREAKANYEATGLVAPRMSYFLANKIISAESGWLYPMRFEQVNGFSRWILLYGDSKEDSTLEAIKVADVYYDSLGEKNRSKTALVYMDITGNKTRIQFIADTLKPSIQSMPGYLSRGYSKNLAHLSEEDEFPVLVETQSSGRIVSKCSGLEEINDFFKKQK